jgi:cytochrome c553
MLVLAGVVVALGLAYALTRGGAEMPAETGQGLPQDGGALPAGFVMPVLAGDAAAGAGDFAKYCQSCHGPSATGTQNGPPLVHKIYEPGHHGDGAFVAAATIGTRQHHWPFGDMPPVEGISEAEIFRIIAYVRALQRANGIGL